MFLDRSTGRGSSENPSHSDRRRSRWVALGLAVGAATPLIATTSAMAQAAEPATQPSADTAAPAPASANDGRELYFQGREYYYHGDWINARKAFDASKAAGYQPGGLTRSQDWFLNKMTAKEQADADKAAKDAADAQTKAQSDTDKVAQAKADADSAAARDAAKQSEKERSAQAETAYKNGVSQYKHGDWIAARSSFNTAQDLAYKASWLETSPGSYLEKMTKKEQADAAKNAADLATNQEQAGAVKRAQDAEAARAAAAPAMAQTTAPEQPAPAAPIGNDLAGTAALEKARAAQRAAESREKVAAARKAIDSNQLDQASDLLTDAVNLDPSNDDAKSTLERVQTLQGKTSGGGLLAQQASDIRIRRQAVLFEFSEAINKANAATSANDFATAKNAITSARVSREAAKTDFTGPELVDFDTRIAQAQIALDQAATQKDARDRELANKATAEGETRKNQQHTEELENTVKAYVKNATDLTREKKYREALGVINQILLIDPNNDYAIGARPLVEDQANFQEQRLYREMFNSALTKQLNMAEEEKIPYDAILRYPTDWPDLSARRDQTTASEQGATQIDKATEATLDRRLPELRFDNVGFADVIDFLRDVTGANIFVNWNALQAASIDRNAPVTARLRDIPFRKALAIILESVGGAQKLSYTIDEGVITISTSEELAKNVVNRVYDIRDLIIDIPDFTDAPNFSLSSTSTNGSSGSGGTGGTGGSGGSGSGGGLFGNSTGGGQGGEDKGASRKDLVDALIKLIQETVAADSWRDAGGTVGSIRELGGQLIVTQTPENQQLLQNLLEKLRETRAIQVTIEARFLTVQRNFLEDIGVNLDATFNLNNSISDKFSPITVGSDTAILATGASTGVPGSLAGQVTQAGTAGLTVSGSFIDDFQVNFILKATQANTNETILTAPRVTLFNGQRAYVLVATQRAYVSDLTPVVGANSVAFDPTISIVESGVLLDVTATVSSDRKYVTLTLRPQLAQLLDIFTFAFEDATTTTPTPTGTTPTPSTVGGSGLVQQPELQITEVRTSVSVPDGGTLLLGGQTLAGETEKEVGVPILSKIPVLKRLFTNRSSAKDEQILLILVKPTIIIQKEAEAKQFPLLSTKVSG